MSPLELHHRSENKSGEVISLQVLSADLIAAQLSPDDPTRQRIAAGRELVTSLKKHLAESEYLLVESTLSGRTFFRVIEIARRSGFHVTIIFVYLDCVDTCVARVTERARKGGHDIPEADIRRRFSRSIDNFWSMYRQIADHWLLVYNSGNQFTDVAIGTGSSILLQDETLLPQFLQLTRPYRDD